MIANPYGKCSLAAAGVLALAFGNSTFVSAAELLTADEINVLLQCNGITGAMEGKGTFTEYYLKDGTITGTDAKGNKYVGTWFVKGDAMCVQYASEPGTCWQVGSEGDQIQLMTDGKVIGTGTIIPGNPDNM